MNQNQVRQIKQHSYCLGYLIENDIPIPDHQLMRRDNKIKITLLKNQDIRNWIAPVIEV